MLNLKHKVKASKAVTSTGEDTYGCFAEEDIQAGTTVPVKGPWQEAQQTQQTAGSLGQKSCTRKMSMITERFSEV
jgi:hypothetical protein